MIDLKSCIIVGDGGEKILEKYQPIVKKYRELEYTEELSDTWEKEWGAPQAFGYVVGQNWISVDTCKRVPNIFENIVKELTDLKIRYILDIWSDYAPYIDEYMGLEYLEWFDGEEKHQATDDMYRQLSYGELTRKEVIGFNIDTKPYPHLKAEIGRELKANGHVICLQRYQLDGELRYILTIDRIIVNEGLNSETYEEYKQLSDIDFAVQAYSDYVKHDDKLHMEQITRLSEELHKYKPVEETNDGLPF